MDWIRAGIGCIRAARIALDKVTTVKALNQKINIQTNADLISNKAIINYLIENNIKCTLHSEEESKFLKINGGDPKVSVIIDPLDNSHLFLRGERCFCSVALMVLINGFPQYSFVGDLSNDDIYYCDERYAYKNGVKIRVPEKVDGRRLILGWAPYYLRLKRLFTSLAPLTKTDYYLYNFGGQLQTAKIATGNYDAYVEVRAETMNEFCAAVIVKRAGGIISTLKGRKIAFNPVKKQTLLVARSKTIHKEILRPFKDKDYEN